MIHKSDGYAFECANCGMTHEVKGTLMVAVEPLPWWQKHYKKFTKADLKKIKRQYKTKYGTKPPSHDAGYKNIRDIQCPKCKPRPTVAKVYHRQFLGGLIKWTVWCYRCKRYESIEIADENY